MKEKREEVEGKKSGKLFGREECGGERDKKSCFLQDKEDQGEK